MATETPLRSRILLIDDDTISREVLAMMLDMHGIPIDTAEDGLSALAMLDHAQADANGLPLPVVILMDTQMPGLSGVALIEALRHRSPARIIAISGSPVTAEILTATDGFLLKPIQIEALVALLESQQDESPLSESPRSESRQDKSQQSDSGPISLEAAAHDPQTGNPGPKMEADRASKVIDPLVFANFKAMMSGAAVKEIYDAVVNDLRPRLVQLSTAMHDGDSKEVRRIAHAIKGGCAMVGLTSATQAALAP